MSQQQHKSKFTRCLSYICVELTLDEVVSFDAEGEKKDFD